MFKIVSSFTRKTTEFPLFNDVFMEHETISKLHKSAENIPGYLGIDENVYRDQYRSDKAMCFENESFFNEFVEKNQLLLYKRKQLIEEHCSNTGHEYKYYILID
jgi:hypothetical protein